MTELSFLIDLLLNHKLGKETKDLIANRIKEIGIVQNPYAILPAMAKQAPSTIAAMVRHEQTAPTTVEVPPIPANIAQTPAANAAMESRNRAIQDAISGRRDKGQTSPRKF